VPSLPDVLNPVPDAKVHRGASELPVMVYRPSNAPLLLETTMKRAQLLFYPGPLKYKKDIFTGTLVTGGKGFFFFNGKLTRSCK
jgi:hypothetical protein